MPRQGNITGRVEPPLMEALADIINPEALNDWLQRPNKQFDGSTPLQVIERGETDRLWRMIWQLREGNSGKASSGTLV